MTLDDAIVIYGSQRLVASALGVTEQAVANWRTRGRIPSFQQLRLYHISGGRVRPDAEIVEGIKGESK